MNTKNTINALWQQMRDAIDKTRNEADHASPEANLNGYCQNLGITDKLEILLAAEASHEGAMSDKTFFDAKIGDRVWLGNYSYSSRKRVGTVTKVSNTMFHVEVENSQEKYSDRYYKSGGYCVGRLWNSDHVTDMATEQDFTDYSNKIAAEKKTHDDKQKAHDALEVKIKNLRDEFKQDFLYVRHDEQNGFSVTFHSLSENFVHKLAKLTEEF